MINNNHLKIILNSPQLLLKCLTRLMNSPQHWSNHLPQIRKPQTGRFLELKRKFWQES
jgi:hypothetical protein